MSRTLHNPPHTERGSAEAEIDIIWRHLASILPTLIVKASYDIPGLNTLSIDPLTIIRAMVVADLAEEVTVVTTKAVPANDSETVSNIVQSKGDFIYLGWTESWDAETENVITFEEFVDIDVGAVSTLKIDKITSADEAPRETNIGFLVNPIKHHVHIKFTNSDSTEKWAKHVWQGVKLLKQDYLDYIWPHLKKILESFKQPVRDIVL